MTLTELAKRNVDAALREALNAASVLDLRIRTNLHQHETDPEDATIDYALADDLRDRLGTIATQLEEIQRRMPELKDW